MVKINAERARKKAEKAKSVQRQDANVTHDARGKIR